MGFKSSIAKVAADIIAPAIYKDQKNAIAIQQSILKQFIHTASSADFGKENDFKNIKTYEDFKRRVRIRDYEGFKKEIELIADGKENVLWKGKPLYFCKSSGTTSGTKYIPVTKEQ